jgi:ribonuclease HI
VCGVARVARPGEFSAMADIVFIYTDESCLGNQFKDRDSPGGAAGLLEVWRGDKWVRRDFWLSEPGTTNNRMALRSAIVPLRALLKPCDVTFTSDSQYLVKGMTEWVHGWKARGWKRKTGVIENLELWQELAADAARHRIKWQWVKGHAGHPQNEYANHLATSAARDQDATDGLVESGFVAWLNSEREKGRYMNFMEFAAPKE